MGLLGRIWRKNSKQIIKRDKWGRFLIVPLGQFGTDLNKERFQNVPKGHLRTVPKCPEIRRKKCQNLYTYTYTVNSVS